MKLRHQTSAESAAAFIESRKRAHEKALRRRAADRPKPAERPASGPYAMLRLPAATHMRLVAHCREYGIRPHTFIERMLEQAKLSRGGT